jgi:hypothetical protein
MDNDPLHAPIIRGNAQNLVLRNVEWNDAIRHRYLCKDLVLAGIDDEPISARRGNHGVVPEP